MRTLIWMQPWENLLFQRPLSINHWITNQADLAGNRNSAGALPNQKSFKTCLDEERWYIQNHPQRFDKVSTSFVPH